MIVYHKKNKKINAMMYNNQHIFYSFIVPVYNGQKYLKRCIESLLLQDNSSYEIIIVDDGSTDDTKTICDMFLSNNNKIKYLRIDHNGQTKARSVGLANSKGDYVCLVDSDDWVSPDYLAAIDNIIQKHGSLDLIFFDAYEVYKGEKIFLPYSLSKRDGVYNRRQIIDELWPCVVFPRKNNFPFRWHAWGVTYKKELLKNYLCKDDTVVLGEDGACIVECVYNASKICFLNKVLYYYNCDNQQSLTKSYGKWNYVGYYRYLRKRFKEVDRDIIKQLDSHYLWTLNTGFFKRKLLNKENPRRISKDFYLNNIEFYTEFDNVAIHVSTPIKYKILYMIVRFKLLRPYLFFFKTIKGL